VFTWAFVRIGHPPGIGDVLLALALLVCATMVLYSLWIVVVAAAFWVVRLDNLSYLFDAIFDFSRWPVTVFKGAFRVVFTFVIPLAVMTTYPAQALLGTLGLQTALLSMAGSLAFALGARWIWKRAIVRYTSASS
jgi:ABC-2 type transport system permease protein